MNLMLAGATVSRVWMMPLLFFLAPVLIVWLWATVPAWLRTRWPFVRLKPWYRRTRRVLRSGIDQIELRRRFAAAAHAARAVSRRKRDSNATRGGDGKCLGREAPSLPNAILLFVHTAPCNASHS
ncbi:hypothetical protein X949_5133 [Burkholderia pseudomallei MSHR5609]|nr:hypothetical protein X949_5133 [Burkholderia pseudomallei MSHR5609]